MTPKEIKSYRSRLFEEFIGERNKPAIRRLQREVIAGELPGSILFIAPYGYSKTTLARHLMRARACRRRNPLTGDPCNECDACQRIGPEFNGEGSVYSRWEIDCTHILDKSDMRGWLNTLKQCTHVDVFWDEFHRIAKRQIAEMLLKFAEDFPKYFDGMNIIAITNDHFATMPGPLFDRLRKVYLFRPEVDEMVAWYEKFIVRCGVNDPYQLIRQMVIRSDCSFRACYDLLAAAKENPGSILDRATLDEFLPPMPTGSESTSNDELYNTVEDVGGDDQHDDE